MIGTWGSPGRMKEQWIECGSRPSTVRQAATMAWPITCPPNTRCQLVFGLLPRNRFTSSGSISRTEIRSIRPLDIGGLLVFLSSRGARKREPGIHNHDNEYGFRVRGFASPRNDGLGSRPLVSHPCFAQL